MSLLLFAGSLFLPHREVFGVSLPLRGILLARLLDGITGGNNSVAQAYLADITDPKKRSKRFGLFAAMMIGPAI
jgi:MFS family permease